MKALWLQVYVPSKHAERAPTALGPKQLMCKVKFSPASSGSRAARKTTFSAVQGNASVESRGFSLNKVLQRASERESEREREVVIFQQHSSDL